MDTKDCQVCYKIICKQCHWEADDSAVAQIQCGAMTACPECGWKPGEPVL
jgi:hypothetical protein